MHQAHSGVRKRRLRRTRGESSHLLRTALSGLSRAQWAAVWPLRCRVPVRAPSASRARRSEPSDLFKPYTVFVTACAIQYIDATSRATHHSCFSAFTVFGSSSCTRCSLSSRPASTPPPRPSMSPSRPDSTSLALHVAGGLESSTMSDVAELTEARMRVVKSSQVGEPTEEE